MSKWADTLSELMDLYIFEPRDDLTLSRIDQAFRELFPGPYTIKWVETDKYYTLDVHFANEADAAFWLLKDS